MIQAGNIYNVNREVVLNLSEFAFSQKNILQTTSVNAVINNLE